MIVICIMLGVGVGLLGRGSVLVACEVVDFDREELTEDEVCRC